jgi:hypothetical protein
MKPGRKSTLIPRIIVTSLALLPFSYVGSYLALLALPATVRVPSFLTAHSSDIQPVYIAGGGEWDRYPDYHGLPKWLFAPLHNYDRIHLRPTLWSGSYPRNQELSFDWLDGQAPASSTPK